MHFQDNDTHLPHIHVKYWSPPLPLPHYLSKVESNHRSARAPSFAAVHCCMGWDRLVFATILGLFRVLE